MANNPRPFIFFSTVLFLVFVLYKQNQLSSSLHKLSSSLDQLNSKVSLLESIIKQSGHELQIKEEDIELIKEMVLDEFRSKEEDIAVIKKMILEKEEIKTVQQNIVYKIDLDQALSYGSRAFIKYKNSFKDNAIQGLTRVRNWLDDSAGNVKDEDKQEVTIQENLKLPQEGTCH